MPSADGPQHVLGELYAQGTGLVLLPLAVVIAVASAAGS